MSVEATVTEAEPVERFVLLAVARFECRALQHQPRPAVDDVRPVENLVTQQAVAVIEQLLAVFGPVRPQSGSLGTQRPVDRSGLEDAQEEASPESDCGRPPDPDDCREQGSRWESGHQKEIDQQKDPRRAETPLDDAAVSVRVQIARGEPGAPIANSEDERQARHEIDRIDRSQYPLTVQQTRFGPDSKQEGST